MPEDCQELRGICAIIQPSQDDSAQTLAPMQSGEIIPRQAGTDDQLILLWLHGRSRHTQRAYRADVRKFRRRVPKPLRSVRLGDLQAFADVLDEAELAPPSRNRILTSIKSLFSFGHRIGYLAFDIARVCKLPPLRDGLSERILAEPDVQRMIALERNPRNRTLLLVLYASGARVSEIAGLCWRDLQPRTDAGAQMTVMGKGGKTRSILLPPSVWSAIQSLQAVRDGEDPVFRSRKQRPLSSSQILRIVKRAGQAAGIRGNVVVHTFRHCHASHSLERGAPIHLVQTTLGHSSVATTGRYLHARPTESSSRFLSL